jgi:hypothetical protein
MAEEVVATEVEDAMEAGVATTTTTTEVAETTPTSRRIPSKA